MTNEKRFCVEVWGDIHGYTTELFHTHKEAERYFKYIRKLLDGLRYIKRHDEIIDTEDGDNYVKLTDFEDFH